MLHTLVIQDYQVELEDLKKRLEKEHIITWVKDAVIKSITPAQVLILCSHNTHAI